MVKLPEIELAFKMAVNVDYENIVLRDAKGWEVLDCRVFSDPVDTYHQARRKTASL